MLHTVVNTANQDKVTFNTSKSDVIIYNQPKKESTVWEIGSNTIESSRSTTHLGLIRDDSNKFDVQPKIQMARRTMYSLMGAGLHGRRGHNPLTSYKIWECFGLPRATYGLESITLAKKDVDSLEKYQRGLLRQLQSLPDRCANIPVYTLLGAKPINVVLDIRALSFFANMIRDKNSIEFKIINRQLAVKDTDSASFTITIRRLLQKYDLPDAYDLIRNTPSKEEWKRMVKEATNNTYRKDVTEEMKNKTSLRYMAVQKHPLDEPHPLYKHTGSNPHEIEKAAIKARILTGTYTLQANRHKFNQQDIDKTCELCRTDTENREHFILDCTALEERRQKHIPSLLELAPELKGKRTELLQCILDCSHQDLTETIQISKDQVQQIEHISRALLYDLHILRTRILLAAKN